MITKRKQVNQLNDRLEDLEEMLRDAIKHDIDTLIATLTAEKQSVINKLGAL